MASNLEYGTQILDLPWINQGRLNHTLVLYVYKEMLNDLELNKVANEFVLECKHWLIS